MIVNHKTAQLNKWKCALLMMSMEHEINITTFNVGEHITVHTLNHSTLSNKLGTDI